MKKILEFIERQISTITTKIIFVEKEINENSCIKTSLELTRQDPDNANYEYINQLIDSEFQDDLDFIVIFKGWFSDYSEEEQIIAALEKLNNILDSLKAKYDDISDELINELNDLKNELNLLKGLKPKLLVFDIPSIKNVLITKEEFEMIDELCRERLSNEELIELYTRIGQSNSILEVERQKDIIISQSLGVDLETLIQMSQDRGMVDNSFRGKVNKIIADIDECINLIDKNIEDETLKKYLYEILKRFEIIKKDMDEDMLDLAELFKEDLNGIDKYNVYTLSVILLIIDYLRDNDYEALNNLMIKHKASKYFNFAVAHERSKILASIDEIIDEYYDEEEYLNFTNSYCMVPENEWINFISEAEIKNIKIMELIHRSKDLLSKMNTEELKKLLDKLNNMINVYKEAQNNEDTELIEEDTSGLDATNTQNYIILLDKDRIMQSIDDMMSKYIDVTIEAFASVMRKLYLTQHDTLYAKRTCKPIMVARNTPNIYDIREERCGVIRICFRPVVTQNGHTTYELLSFAYGGCGNLQKYKNLTSSIKEYTDYIDEYHELESHFRNKHLTEMGSEITKGFDLYNSLLELSKQKKKGCSLND